MTGADSTELVEDLGPRRKRASVWVVLGQGPLVWLLLEE